MPENFEYRIVIYSVSGGEVANILRGYIVKGDERIKFSGVAYGRFGGQNVVPRFSPTAKKKIKEIFGSFEEFEADLQQKLMRGDFEMEAR